MYSITELKPHEVLKVAIWIERRNTAIYQNFAEMFQGYDEEIRKALLDMADEETDHGKKLEELYRHVFGNMECALTDKDIKEIVESPQLEDGEVFITDSMKLEDALLVGLKAEQNAKKFYTDLARRTTNAELKTMYETLANVEVEHELLMQKKLDEVRQR